MHFNSFGVKLSKFNSDINNLVISHRDIYGFSIENDILGQEGSFWSEDLEVWSVIDIFGIYQGNIDHDGIYLGNLGS